MSKAENSSFTQFFGSVTVETDEQTRDVVQTQRSRADGLRIKSLPFHLFPAARLHIRNLVWHINEVNKSIFAAQWAQTAALPLHVKQKPCVNKALSAVSSLPTQLTSLIRGASYVFTWLHWKENESCLFRQLILHPSETLNLCFHHVYLFMDEHSVCGFMLLLESEVIHMKPLMHTPAAIRQKAVSMYLHVSQLLIHSCFDFQFVSCTTRSWSWRLLMMSHVSSFCFGLILEVTWTGCPSGRPRKSNTSSWFLDENIVGATQCWWSYWSTWGSNTDLN